MKEKNPEIQNPEIQNPASGMDGGRILTRYIEDELKESYLTYAMSVITNRAIPDVRDGLKPSDRRILYAMNELNLAPNRKHVKCAQVVGAVMGRYHPHGNDAIYGTLVRMAQPFAMRYPMVDGQGNFGTIDGDPPGAMRYTDARLSAIAMEMLVDIDKDTVDFQPNYDDSTMEPMVLPARIPNLLLNGTLGIAVGYMTKIPPHNLNELVDGIILLMENPETTVDDLLTIIEGPDFPTGGMIVGRDGIREAYQTGKGHLRVRARINIERNRNNRESLIIVEIPFQMNKESLLVKMEHLVNSKRITGISDIRDESDRNVRVVVELKRGEIAQVVLNQLYKHTELQNTFNVINLCLVDGQPCVLSLLEMLTYYLEHRRDVIRRRTSFELVRCERRVHILEGYQIALSSIEEVIRIIESSDSAAQAREELGNNFELSDIQANEILSMTLRQLTGMERQRINQEHTDLLVRVEELKAVLENPVLVDSIIKEELLELKAKYGDERRTQIVEDIGDIEIEDLIADEDMVITISHHGYIKRLSIKNYRRQRRGGIGVIGMGTKEEDFVEHLFVASNHQYILFFTDQGKCYWMKVFEIPETGRTSRGRAIVNLLRLQSDENITAFVPVREFREDRYLFMTTRRGVVKRCTLKAFSRPISTGIIAITLAEDDQLIAVHLTEGNQDMALVTHAGTSIRFHETDVRSMGRSAQGVRGIRLAENDWVVGSEVVEDETTLLVVTENGYGKRTAMKEYRVQSRGGKGVIAIKTSIRNGGVIGVKRVVNTDELIVMSSTGMVTRMAVSDIRVIGRNTQGVRIMALRSNETVVDIAKISGESQVSIDDTDDDSEDVDADE